MEQFISEFCKVEFLCYAGSPNWLGKLLFLTLVGTAIYLFMKILQLVEDGLEGWWAIIYLVAVVFLFVPI